MTPKRLNGAALGSSCRAFPHRLFLWRPLTARFIPRAGPESEFPQRDVLPRECHRDPNVLCNQECIPQQAAQRTDRTQLDVFAVAAHHDDDRLEGLLP